MYNIMIVFFQMKRPRGRPRIHPIKPKRPRGRPRKDAPLREIPSSKSIVKQSVNFTEAEPGTHCTSQTTLGLKIGPFVSAVKQSESSGLSTKSSIPGNVTTNLHSPKSKLETIAQNLSLNLKLKSTKETPKQSDFTEYVTIQPKFPPKSPTSPNPRKGFVVSPNSPKSLITSAIGTSPSNSVQQKNTIQDEPQIAKKPTVQPVATLVSQSNKDEKIEVQSVSSLVGQSIPAVGTLSVPQPNSLSYFTLQPNTVPCLLVQPDFTQFLPTSYVQLPGQSSTTNPFMLQGLQVNVTDKPKSHSNTVMVPPDL